MVGAIATDLVLPIIRDIDRETSQQIHAEVVILFQDDVVKREIQSNIGPLLSIANGEVRVVIREAHHHDSFRFDLESIFQGIAPGT
ncbi:hypothetical protein ASE26_06605 [Duganella sp. Root198D2]|nr:hypothetical protein ASE26_06605 [Duganella sp. Root198D2]